MGASDEDCVAEVATDEVRLLLMLAEDIPTASDELVTVTELNTEELARDEEAALKFARLEFARLELATLGAELLFSIGTTVAPPPPPQAVSASESSVAQRCRHGNDPI
jgi:hypothetical protein